MSIRTIISLVYILFALLISSDVGSQDMKSIEEENHILISELELARQPDIYFMLNVKERKIDFKARGIILKEIRVEDINLWGDHLIIKPYTMTKKSSFSTPVRDTINPQENDKEEVNKDKKKTFQLKALELSDMPTSFSITLDGNVSISVKPADNGIVQGLYSAANSLTWYISRPLYTVWNAVRNKPYTAIQLRLTKEDARSLYWSFVEGGKIIIN